MYNMANLSDFISKSKMLKSDPEQLKITVGIIKKCIIDLNNAKIKADNAWINYRSNVDDSMSKIIDEKKAEINKEYSLAIDDLERNSDVLDSIANIWKETEIELNTSSKNFEAMFNSVNKLFNIDDKSNNELK